MPSTKNIYLATPYKLNQKSDYRKCNLVAFGLSQPNKPLHVEAKQELANIFNKFEVSSYDLAIDSSFPIDTSLLNNFGAITKDLPLFTSTSQIYRILLKYAITIKASKIVYLVHSIGWNLQSRQMEN